MTDGLILLAFIAGAAIVAVAALVVARVLRVPAFVARHTATPESRYELFVGALGLMGLVGALALLFGAGLSLGLSTTSAALLLLICAGGLSMALRPAPERAAFTVSMPEQRKATTSKAA